MKKLMIAAAIVCAAVAANASAFNWSCTGVGASGKLYDKSKTLLANGTAAYLLCTADITQSKFLDGVRSAENVTTYVSGKAISAANNAVNANSKIAALASDFTYGTTGSSYDFYFAIIKGDDILIAPAVTGAAKDMGTTSLAFASVGGVSSATYSQTDNGTGAFSSAGWYATKDPEPTPEPTSAMLMLLGVAGLALKRKRA